MDADLGTVLAVHNQFAAVRTETGDGVATIAGKLRRTRPVVGDVVRLHTTPDGSLRMDEIQERRGTLTRAAFRGRPQVVAANVDLLVVVAATADPPLRANLIDRYLVAAWRGGIETGLALTKVDLPHGREEIERVTSLLERLGHAVIEVSIPRGEGIQEVRELIGQRRAVLAGHSGVGKTTLSNAITGRADPTGVVNEVIGRGRQTTTVARLIDLPGGGELIDTAGVRSFGIADVTPEELQEAFPEIAAVSSQCRWRPCLHHEGQNGCAVPGAPGIEPERLASYRRILEELEEERPER
jgi:ribosome biogenesis GTPase / thiamine phosphate phosphatase